MRKLTSHTSFIYLFLFLTIVTISCKKKDQAEPAPMALADNVDMGTESSVRINVLANDSYKDGARVVVLTPDNDGIAVVNEDNSVTFTSKPNFYGTVTLQYRIADNNGNSIGNILIKRGTAEQINTSKILNKYVSPNKDITTVLFLYSINGDTTRVYTSEYQGYGDIIDYIGFLGDRFTISSMKALLPEIGTSTYSIVADGNVLTNANFDNSPVLLTNIEDFTDSAKKLDMSGYMTVNGISLQCLGKTLVYTTKVK